MRPRLAFLSFCAAIAACAAAMPLPAVAGVPADAVAKVDAAAAELAPLVKQAQANGTVPLWSEAEARPVLARLTDPALLGAPPYAASDMPALDSVVTEVRATYQPYIDFLQGAKTVPEMQSRAASIQDEMARYSAFFLRAQAAMMPVLGDFVAHLKPEEINDARLRGLRQMRLGITQMVQGAGLLTRGATPENQAILVDAVADSAKPIAAGLSMTARAQVAEELHEQFKGLPAPLQARIDAAGQAMASAQCSGLCTLQ